jgi:hypothetical protein
MQVRTSVITRVTAWLLWSLNWFTGNGTVRNGFLCVRAIQIWLKRPAIEAPSSFTRAFSDLWNLAALVTAIWALSTGQKADLWVSVALYRCVAILVSQAAVLVNTDRHVYGLDPPKEAPDRWRLLIIALVQFAEIALWFAVVYAATWHHFTTYESISTNDPWGALYLSVVTIATVGFGDLHPRDVYGARLVIFEIACGMFMTLVVLGRFVGLIGLPDRETRTK